MLAVITLISLFTLAVSTAITIAFYYGVAYLGGKLFGPDVPESDTGATPNAQSRSWNPRSTQQEGVARPRAYGKNLHHGNIVAKWTGVDGDEREVLYMIVEHGDGPTKGIVTPIADNVFLNDQPASNFGSVDIQERVGTMNQTVMTGFEKTKLEHPLNNELVLNEAVTFTTPNDFFDDIEYTIVWPNGLRKYQKSGKRKSSSVTIKVRIREYPSGGWTEIFNAAISASRLEPLFKLYKVNTLSPGYVERGKQYDLEFTRTSAIGDRHINDVHIRSAREVIDVAFTRPGKALIGIKAIATSKLSGQIDVKVIREDKLIWTWNGSAGTIEYSRNRAWVVFDAFTQPVIDGDGDGEPWVIDHYEGLDPSRLDLDFFLTWALFCSDQVPDGFGETEDRIACDTILDFQTSVWQFTSEVAKIGRAFLYWQGHMLTGYVDKSVGEITALVTMDNVMARTWKNAWTEEDELAGKAEVFFNDSRQGYERTHAALPNESAGKYTRIISIEGVGINTRGTAIHLANYLLKRNELIRNVNNFQQYKDAFRYRLGDVLRIQHQTPVWGEGYRVIKSQADNKVKLDRICDVSAGDLIFIQSYDETLKKVRIDSYTVLSAAGKVVTIVETWDVTPLKNYMVAIGAAGAIKLRRIIKIDSTSDNYFDITVETYDAELFDADDLDPNNPDQNYVWGRPANPLTRPVTRDDVIELITKLAMPQVDIDTPQTSNLTWTGNATDTVSWSKTDADEAIVFRYKGTEYEITPDSTTAEFIYWDPAYPTTFRTTNVQTTAFTLGKWVMCRNKDGVAYPATPIAIMHGGIIQVGTIIASQIIITGINALDLLNGPAEAGADVTGDHEGDINIDNITDGVTYKKYLDTEKTKLTGIDPGADVTGDNVASSITGQGALATQSSVALNTGEVTDKSLANLDSSANTKLGGIETSADVTADHADDVIYRGNTPPAHKAGRVWYCLVNGSYVNYTLYKSTGTVWEKIGDETAQHQADIQLANLGEKSVDSLTDGSTYARMLAAWKHSSDPTKMDLSLGFGASLSTAQIGLLAVHTAQIDDLAVDTLQIKGEAVTIGVSAYTDGNGSPGDIQEITITATGQPLIIIATVRMRTSGGASDFGNYTLKLYRDANELYSSDACQLYGGGVGEWTHSMVTVAFRETPSPGTYTYKLNFGGLRTTPSKIFLFVMEVKK